MLAGDFTTVASPRARRQINLGGGFVGNRINPAPLQPCRHESGEALAGDDRSLRTDYVPDRGRQQWEGIGRLDYQLTNDQSVFGRYMATFIRKPPALPGRGRQRAQGHQSGLDNLAHALTLGDTWVLGPTMVNSVRVAYNRTTVNRYNTPHFDPTDLGIKLHPYIRGQMPIQVYRRSSCRPARQQRSSGTTSTRWPMT